MLSFVERELVLRVCVVFRNSIVGLLYGVHFILSTQYTLLSSLPGTEHEPVTAILQQGVVLALVSQLWPFGIDSWNASTAYRDRRKEEGC